MYAASRRSLNGERGNVGAAVGEGEGAGSGWERHGRMRQRRRRCRRALLRVIGPDKGAILTGIWSLIGRGNMKIESVCALLWLSWEFEVVVYIYWILVGVGGSYRA